MTTVVCVYSMTVDTTRGSGQSSDYAKPAQSNPRSALHATAFVQDESPVRRSAFMAIAPPRASFGDKKSQIVDVDVDVCCLVWSVFPCLSLSVLVLVLVLSCPVLSCPVLSCLVLSCLVFPFFPGLS